MYILPSHTVKVQVIPWHVYAGTDGMQRYRSETIATSVLEGSVCLATRTAQLFLERPGTYRVRRWVGFVPKSVFDLRNVQLVASHYTDYTIPNGLVPSNLQNWKKIIINTFNP